MLALTNFTVCCKSGQLGVKGMQLARRGVQCWFCARYCNVQYGYSTVNAIHSQKNGRGSDKENSDLKHQRANAFRV